MIAQWAQWSKAAQGKKGLSLVGANQLSGGVPVSVNLLYQAHPVSLSRDAPAFDDFNA